MDQLEWFSTKSVSWQLSVSPTRIYDCRNQTRYGSCTPKHYAEKVERLTKVRYRYGAVALKTLLDQQETTRTARLTLVNTKQSQYNAYVTLMQALGGSPVKELAKQ